DAARLNRDWLSGRLANQQLDTHVAIVVEFPGCDQAARLDPVSSLDDRLYRAQDLRATPKVFQQMDQAPAALLNRRAITRKARWFGMAKTEDRLIDVAHGIEAIGRTDQRQKARLLPVGVLKFVHQHMVKLCLQVRARLRMVFEQPDGALLEIRKIQRAC